MITAQTALGASATTGDGFTLLDHDLNGWIVALVVAVVAAFIYEAIMALTRLVTLRIPFLVLYLARITTPKRDWPDLFAGWKGELWAILRSREKRWFLCFCKGMAFATPLALGAARVTAKASTPSRTAQRAPRTRRSSRRRTRRLEIGAATAFAIVGLNGPWLWQTIGKPFVEGPAGQYAAGIFVSVWFVAAAYEVLRIRRGSRKRRQR
ncbi:hypothetical protein [Streptomyces sp. WAC 04229]|uniref:hypothetical protein n=1 Tax=Streptomyces sp. WAC 04229 TaxID=2203206 RepID=UPI003D71733A